MRRANQFACQGIVPDRTILLVPPSTKDGLIRATKNDGADRLESAGVEFHERVRNAFAEIATDDPKRIRTVYSADKKSKTSQAVFAELADIFPFMVELLADESGAHFAPLDIKKPHTGKATFAAPVSHSKNGAE